MIKPVNNHLLIEPVEHQIFISSSKGMYEEMGVVKALPDEFSEVAVEGKPEVGDTVFFDSWLAACYPTGEEDKVFWLVNYEDVRAIQKKHGNA